ncbi:MAG: hypothetical protein JOZ13_03135 [Alphaproteobacteria bacterium]|nr:hypothetical protein [Alphaproteobacteria bacterium]
MNDLTFDLAIAALFCAVVAVVAFVRTMRRPPSPPDLMKDWLGNDPQ